jgi:hypothetical protein
MVSTPGTWRTWSSVTVSLPSPYQRKPIFIAVLSSCRPV